MRMRIRMKMRVRMTMVIIVMRMTMAMMMMMMTTTMTTTTMRTMTMTITMTTTRSCVVMTNFLTMMLAVIKMMNHEDTGRANQHRACILMAFSQPGNVSNSRLW